MGFLLLPYRQVKAFFRPASRPGPRVKRKNVRVELFYITNSKPHTMQSQVVSELINLARFSTMGSKHAAALVAGKRILSMGTNYSLPAADLVDTATMSSNQARGSKTSSGQGEDCVQGTTLAIRQTRCQKCPKAEVSHSEDRTRPGLSCRRSCSKEVQGAPTGKSTEGLPSAQTSHVRRQD